MSFGMISLNFLRNRNLFLRLRLLMSQRHFYIQLRNLEKQPRPTSKCRCAAVELQNHRYARCRSVQVCARVWALPTFCLITSFYMFNIHSYVERCRFGMTSKCLFLIRVPPLSLAPGSSTIVSVPPPVHLPEGQSHKSLSPRKQK